MLFSVGGMFAVYEGYEKIKHPHAIEAWYWPVGVLVFAIIAEGFSFRTAIKESNVTRGELSWQEFIRRAKAPELPVVLLEDFGALIGLVLALARRRPRTGHGRRRLGRHRHAVHRHPADPDRPHPGGGDQVAAARRGAPAPDEVEKIKAAIVDGDTVTAVIHMRTLHLGPEELLVAAKIAVQHDDTAEEVAAPSTPRSPASGRRSRSPG